MPRNGVAGECGLTFKQFQEYSSYSVASCQSYASRKKKCGSLPENWNYEGAISKKSGLFAKIYSISGTNKMVIAFRGTNLSDLRDVVTDLEQLGFSFDDIVETLPFVPKGVLAPIRALKKKERAERYKELFSRLEISYDRAILMPNQYNDAVSIVEGIERRYKSQCCREYRKRLLNKLADHFPTKEKCEDYVGEILKNCTCNVDLTGHSLGGGVAEYAAAALGNTAVVFNAAGLGRDNVKIVKGNLEKSHARIVHMKDGQDPVSAPGYDVGEVCKFDCPESIWKSMAMPILSVFSKHSIEHLGECLRDKTRNIDILCKGANDLNLCKNTRARNKKTKPKKPKKPIRRVTEYRPQKRKTEPKANCPQGYRSVPGTTDCVYDMFACHPPDGCTATENIHELARCYKNRTSGTCCYECATGKKHTFGVKLDPDHTDRRCKTDYEYVECMHTTGPKVRCIPP